MPGIGLMSGKTGIAILLYHYARFMNEPKMAESADILIGIVMREIKPDVGKEFNNGISGIIWGIDYLIKQDFLEAEEDLFCEIDTILFQENKKKINLDDLGSESTKGIYAWNRYNTAGLLTKNKWYQHLENCVHHFYDILVSKYTNYILPVFPCKMLVYFFHFCQTVQQYGLFRPEIDVLYEELPEIVKISYREEKSISDKYMLTLMLHEIPMLEKCISRDDAPQAMTLSDVNNFYLTRLILGCSFPTPEIICKTILSIVEDQKQISELLYSLNPYNAGLGNYVGGFSWAMLQCCMEYDRK
ncbi:MAG: hypothetical protein LBQ60_07460 [Bacteroidales bacterium]|nr:hypothetical protein [Bacteroidales bacterium]